MDHRFMEDENELPYLLSEKRDKFSSGSDNLSNDEKLNRILNSMNISTSERSVLKDKLISFLNAKDCKGLRLRITLMHTISYSHGKISM